MNRRWICNDVWMDMFPCFDHAQLGLKLALLSPRFNALVDKHFDGKTAEFPLTGRPLPSKIRFKYLQMCYFDHSVIAFLRSNQHIFDKRGTNLQLSISSSHATDGQPIWDVLTREIFPIFSANIRHLGFTDDGQLDNLLRRTSPTILTDLDQLNSIDSFGLSPDAIGDFDGPISTASQALFKWLHSPRKDGQPKRLRCGKDLNEHGIFEWINNLKEHFLRATISSVSYQIHFSVYPSMQIVPFELVNEWTKEKLTLAKSEEGDDWIMKRRKIIGETAAVQQQKKDENWDNNCHNVFFWLVDGTDCIGPLSPPLEELEEEAGQSSEKGASSADN